MRRLLIMLVFVFLLLACLGAFDKCNGADLGYAMGQNGVQMVELNYGVFNYARHTEDSTYNIFSIRFRYGRNFGPLTVDVFAGLGYGISDGTADDLAGSTIGHWGGEVAYGRIGLRFSHWSNPFEGNEYGHNMLTLFWRW